jgi:hypothetical protein
MKRYFVILLSLLFLISCDDDETSITGSISVDSITPAPDSELPELGEKVTFTFENILWDLEHKDEAKEVDIVVWFVEATSDGEVVGKVGWEIFTTTNDSGVETITLEMPSWNHTTFTKKPTTLSIGICESSVLIEEFIKTCSEISVTETHEYQ